MIESHAINSKLGIYASLVHSTASQRRKNNTRGKKERGFLGGGRGNTSARCLRHKQRRKAGCICNDLMPLLNNSEKNKHSSSSSSSNNNNNSNPQLL